MGWNANTKQLFKEGYRTTLFKRRNQGIRSKKKKEEFMTRYTRKINISFTWIITFEC